MPFLTSFPLWPPPPHARDSSQALLLVQNDVTPQKSPKSLLTFCPPAVHHCSQALLLVQSDVTPQVSKEIEMTRMNEMQLLMLEQVMH